jgi:hypothetical protein
MMSDDNTTDNTTEAAAENTATSAGERPFAVHHSGASSCGSYSTGHDPHWIQVLRAEERGRPVALRDVRLIDPVSFEVDIDTIDGTGQETHLLRNHDAIQIFATWQQCGEGRYVHGRSLLQIGPATGQASFSVTTDELRPCGTVAGPRAGRGAR